MRLLRMHSLAVVLTTALFSTLSYSQSAPPVANVYTQELHPTTNFGTGAAINSLTLQNGANNGNVYIQFSLADIPAEANVQKATLQLYVNQVLGAGSFDVYQLNSEWSQATTTYTNAPSLGISATGNNPAAIPATADQFILIDVTPLVQGWLNGTIPNNGLALSMTTSSGGALFDSKEAINTSHMPELQIVLNAPAGPQGPMGPTGPTGATNLVGPTGSQSAGTGFNFRNAFDPTATYSSYDVVTYNGSTYDALATIAPGGATPDINTNWALMAQQGTMGLTGATGPQGPVGLTGATGAAGPQGIQGVAGATGVIGPQGPIGMTGPQGVQGLTGVTGAVGANGPGGPQGPIGVTGATGATGPQGPMGLTGATGPQGTAGTGFNFRNAFDPAATYSPYDVVTYNGSTYNALAAVAPGGTTPDINTSWALIAQQGAAGATGATGPQGPTGPAGPPGATTVTGPQGTTGSQAAGPGFNFRNAFDPTATYSPYDVVTYDGSTYDAIATIAPGGTTPDINASWALMAQQGAAGVAGPTGTAGATGATGPQGPMGLTGAAGTPGAIGSQGPMGLTGAAGTPGAIGSQGPIGLTGAPGPQGTAGTGFNFRTAFNPTATYAPYDVVTYNGSTYDALAAVAPGAATPDVNPSWALMAQQGAKGAAGTAGPNSVSAGTTSTIAGMIKGSGGALAPAIAGTDYVAPSGSITGNAATATQLSATGSNGTFWGVSGGVQGFYQPSVLQGLPQQTNVAGGSCQAITASNGTATVNWATSSCAVITASGTNVSSIALSNPTSGAAYTLGLCNDGSPRFWSLPGTLKQASMPNYPSECVYKIYTYDGANYQGPGSTANPTVIYGTERAAPTTSAPGAFVCWWDAGSHVMTCNDNSSGSNANMVVPVAGPNGNQFVSYIDSAGIQHMSQAGAGSGTVTTTGSPASGALAKYSGSTSITNAGFSDIVAMWTGCSGAQYLGADGACHTAAGSGTVTSSGSPVFGNISKFTNATNIVPASALDIVNLFGSCSAAQYLGGDGACHVASGGGGGGGTVTSVTFAGDGVIDSSTPSMAVTASGQVTATIINQGANTSLRGPVNGSAAAPTFRQDVIADLPAGTVYSVVPATSSGDTLNCATTPGITSNPVAFATTISRPAFTQTAGAVWQLGISAIETSSASGLAFQFEIKDNGAVVYLSGAENNALTISNLPVGAAIDEQISGTNLASAALTVYPMGSVFSNFGMNALNHSSQTTGYNSNNPATLSVLMECSAATAGNSVTLTGLTLTRVY